MASDESLYRPALSGRSRLAIFLALVATLIRLPIGALLWMTAVPGQSYAGRLPALESGEAALAARLEAHVRAIAQRPRNLSFPTELEASARYLEAALAQAGYRVHRQHFEARGQTFRNIEAVIEGDSAAAETLVVGAHYDSCGSAPGANDNGSGTAALIELARSLADLRGRSKLRLRLVFFANEEPPFFKTGAMGSFVYARRLRDSGEPILGMMALETLGYYSDRPGSQRYPLPLNLLYPDTGNFVAFVGTTGSRSLVRRAVGSFRRQARFPSEGGVAPGFIQGIDWSDHWSFAQFGFPALMVTDTAPFRYPHYHSRWDRPDKLDYARLARVTAGLERVVREWATAADRKRY